MPTYNFICDECGIRFEKYLSINNQGDRQICPNGHLLVRRVFTPPTIVFKGSGFYSTDNRSKSQSSKS